MKRAEWLFPALLLALLFVGYGLIPLPREGESDDSFSVEGGGKSAFYQLASKLLPKVRRSTEALPPKDPDVDTLVLLGPARYPDRAQWQALHDWVAQGKALVFAARWEDPAVALEPFGIEIVPTRERKDVDEGKETEDHSKEPPAASNVETELVEGEIDWRSFGQILHKDKDDWEEVVVGGTPQVVWQKVGNGAVVVLASDFIFTNLSLTKGDNGVLAFRILETVSPTGTVYFDERLNEAGAPRVVGVLFEGPLRLPTIQLVIVAVLFGWMESRRFGPVASTGRAERRSLVEHAKALGSLHFRVGTSARLVSSYLDFFRRELGLRYQPGAKGAVLEATLERPSISELLGRALRASRSPNLDRSRTASILASLARVRATQRSNDGRTTSPARNEAGRAAVDAAFTKANERRDPQARRARR